MRNEDLPRRGKTCFVCRKNIACNKSIKAHAMLHVMPRNNDFRCRLPVMCCREECGRNFKTRAELFDHVAKSLSDRCCESK